VVIASAMGNLVEACVAIPNCGLDGACEYACAHTGNAKNAEKSNATATADLRGRWTLPDLISSSNKPGMVVNLKKLRHYWLPRLRNIDEDQAVPACLYGPSFTARKRSAFVITLTDESDMAAAAMIGDKRMPKAG
jgi:hypothetical protein